MDDERLVEDIVTKFLLNTCRLRPELCEPAEQATMCCIEFASYRSRDEREGDFIPLTTGSVAEFYIEPMLPHIGDIDVMYYLTNLLAIPRGHSPPTQLPDEFHNYVEVMEITDSHLPGYVYLVLRYLLTECAKDGRYKAVECDMHIHVSGDKSGLNVHGPAVLTFRSGMFSVDGVRCVRCLSWPSQAADWPTRRRNYGWPDSATVGRVVSNGCDVVNVAHRQCRQHEWMRRRQYRLSFSRAEIVLLNSWMPVQQIVYHVLRVFVKKERLTESDDNSDVVTLSNYHIKTLMLWACELKSRNWWTDDFNIVRICVILLNDLAVCLTEAQCPHYFIDNCNLVDSSHNLEIIRNRISRDKSWFLSWFINNYVRRCSQLCPPNFTRLFDDISSPIKLQIAVSAIIQWRRDTVLSPRFDLWNPFQYAGCQLAYIVANLSPTARSTHCHFTELKKLNSDLVVSFLSSVFLHISRKISRSGLSDELMDVLAVALGQSVGPRRYSSRRSSVLLLSKAVNLMKAVGDRTESRSTVQLIEIELSKAYLYRALRCKDSDSDSIYCLANVYLAVLYYTTGHYQSAIDHCTLVMRSQDHSQCSSHVVQGELLPKIDDDIDSVLGLAVFYQYVRTAALNQQQQTQHVSVFTTKLFAQYLHNKILPLTNREQLCEYTNSQSSTCEVLYNVKFRTKTDMQLLFLADVLQWKLEVFQKCKSARKEFSRHYYLNTCSATPTLSTTDLVKLLQKSAVEHLTSYRHIEARYFGSRATIVTTDFEALYAYKRGDYQQCLQLSTQNVHTLLYAVVMANTYIVPDFVQMMDDDIVSLTALTLIVNPECRGDSRYIRTSQLTLSLYLMTQCQLKLHHSATSLAQTLNYVQVAETKLPFEYVLNLLTLKLLRRKIVLYITS